MRKNKPLVVEFVEQSLLNGSAEISVIVLESFYQRVSFLRRLQNYYELKYPKWEYDYTTHMLRNPDRCNTVLLCAEPSIERLRGMQIKRALILNDLHLKDYIKNSVIAPGIRK